MINKSIFQVILPTSTINKNTNSSICIYLVSTYKNENKWDAFKFRRKINFTFLRQYYISNVSKLLIWKRFRVKLLAHNYVWQVNNYCSTKIYHGLEFYDHNLLQRKISHCKDLYNMDVKKDSRYKILFNVKPVQNHYNWIQRKMSNKMKIALSL